MRINNNLQAVNTHRQLGVANLAGNKSMEKLSSGMRINRAADDAAGLSISEKMRNQIRGLNRASSNSQDGISLIQTAEGALGETHSILKRMRELVVQSGNEGTLQEDDLEAIKDEFGELAKELDGITERTEFNGKKLLDGKYSGTLQIGANEGQQLDLDMYVSDINGRKDSNLSGTELVKGKFEGYEVNITDDISAIAGEGITKIEIKNGDTGTANSSAEIDKDGKVTITIKSGEDLTVDEANALLKEKGIDLRLVGDGDLEEETVDNIDTTGTKVTVGGSVSSGDLGVNLSGVEADDNGVIDVETAIKDGIFLEFEGFEQGQVKMITDANLERMDAANKAVSKLRSHLGANQNRLEYTIRNLDNAAENIQASESRIRDVDMAKEMIENTRQNILQQASTAMLAQANMKPQSVLQLLG